MGHLCWQNRLSHSSQLGHDLENLRNNVVCLRFVRDLMEDNLAPGVCGHGVRLAGCIGKSKAWEDEPKWARAFEAWGKSAGLTDMMLPMVSHTTTSSFSFVWATMNSFMQYGDLM